MNFLIKPEFTLSNGTVKGILDMDNDDELDKNINTVFKRTKRLNETNYYLLENVGEINNIDNWVSANGFDQDMDVIVEFNGNRVPAKLKMNPMTAGMPADYNFNTAEGIRAIRNATDNENNDLADVVVENLMADKTNFTGISFTDSILLNASFKEALLPLTFFKDAQLEGANFELADLRFTNMHKADLTSVGFIGAKLRSANLSGANLLDATLDGADLTDANLSDTNLTGAHFKNSILTGTNFSGSNWQNTYDLTDNQTFTQPEAQFKFTTLATMKPAVKQNTNRLAIVDKKIVSQLKAKPTAFDILQDMPKLRTLIIEQDGNDKIKTLPPTIFAGLTKLDSLELKSLWLANLPETIFQDLTDLTSLSIEYNDFKSLPATLFKNNKKLKKLVIRNDDTLTALPENIFQGLEQLEELDLNGNRLKSLPERIFQGLPNLKILDLDRNDFTTLPAGIFDGLHLEEPIPADILSLVVKKASVKPVLNLEQEAEDDEALPGDKNTCYAVIDLYDKNIDNYLAKDPGNFILKVGKNKECESLENLKLQYFSAELNDYEGYYECSQTVMDSQKQTGRTQTAFREGDYYSELEYVKVGSYNNFIVKPDWFYDGPVPEPRIFQLVSTGNKKRLISKRIAKHYGTNVVSDVHCDPLDTFDIYELKPVFLKASTPKQTARQTARQSNSKSNSKSKSKSRRSRVYTLNRTRRYSTASDINVGGGMGKQNRKPRRNTRKKRKYYKR